MEDHVCTRFSSRALMTEQNQEWLASFQDLFTVEDMN
jgi:hypothetical protein